MNKYLTLSIVSLYLLLAHTTTADVLSKNISNDIAEPQGTYPSTKPYMVDINAIVFSSATGSCTIENYNGCTLLDVLNDINRTDDFKPEVKIRFTSNNYFSSDVNATLRQRGGQTSRRAPLKSFRIKLNKKSPLWNKQRRIQLIKSYDDLSRIRNKLSFDSFKEIPHLPSLNTQFIKFTINDKKTIKQGLYTHVEHVGKEYLKRRNWNKKSSLYKAEYFYFQNDIDLAVDQKGKPINKKKFEQLLEIKTGKNHKPLTEMLKALEDKTLNFNTDILNVYFDRDNLLTWLAVNILINNIDTKIHNYYLYNPYDSKKFYFIPWDYDRAWGLAQEQDKKVISQLPNWWFTHANWQENILVKRLLSTPKNIELLKQAIDEIKTKYLTQEKIQEKVDSYRNIIFPVIREEPDWNTIKLKGKTDPEKIAEYNRIMSLFANNVEFNYKKFIEHLKDPMPFRLNKPIIDSQNSEIKFTWSKSETLFKQQIIYDLEISSDPYFKDNIIETINNIPENMYSLRWKHPKGVYFYRIKSKDANNPAQYWQLAWNRKIKLNNGLQAYGVESFKISQDPKYKNGNISILLLLALLVVAFKRHRTKASFS